MITEIPLDNWVENRYALDSLDLPGYTLVFEKDTTYIKNEKRNEYYFIRDISTVPKTEQGFILPEFQEKEALVLTGEQYAVIKDLFNDADRVELRGNNEGS